MVDLNSISLPSSSLLLTSFCFIKNLENCGTYMETLLYLTWITKKDLLSSTGNSAQYSVITYGYRGGGGMGEGIVREFGMNMDTLLYLTWRTSKDLLSSTGNSAQYSVITLCLPVGKDRGRDS